MVLHWNFDLSPIYRGHPKTVICRTGTGGANSAVRAPSTDFGKPIDYPIARFELGCEARLNAEDRADRF